MHEIGFAEILRKPYDVSTFMTTVRQQRALDG